MLYLRLGGVKLNHPLNFSASRYVYQGNLETDWRPEDSTQDSNWYHVPWMHVGNNPREFMRGLTRERDSQPKELDLKQTRSLQNWAIGSYNKIGAYTIGQVWKDPRNPNPGAAQFLPGTVVVKILFTEAAPEEVPELEGSLEWVANIHSTIDRNSPKAIKKLRLLQMDVAVKDPNANATTGWVFGTFVYDKTAPGETAWEKMVPVGLMWGNDPGVTPEKVRQGTPLKETIINENIPVYARRRLGWAGRLNGPVDNFVSSCASCHSTAQYPTAAPMTFPNNSSVTEKLRWFRNIKPGQSFDTGQIPLDYSLQLAVSLQNFRRQQAIVHGITKNLLAEEPPEPPLGPTITR